MSQVGPRAADSMRGHDRHVSKLITCFSGRNLEYQLIGRCSPMDPVLLYCTGMAMHGVPGLAAADSWSHFKCLQKPEVSPQQDAEIPFTIVCVNRHGYGKSTMGVGAGDYSIKMFADDVIEVMDALRADVFSVVGMSTGGNYALAIAAQYPTRVSALGLVSCDASYAPGFPAGSKMNAPPTDPTKPTYVDGLAACRGVAGCCAPCCPRGLMADCNVEVKALPFKYEDVKCKAHIMHGDADGTVDVNCARYHAVVLGRVECTIVPSAGHGGFEKFFLDNFFAKVREGAITFKPTCEEKELTTPITMVREGGEDSGIESSRFEY